MDCNWIQLEKRMRNKASGSARPWKNLLYFESRLQNSPYFCVFKYARAVKQKVWNEAENRERDWGETLKIRACEARAVRTHKTLTPRVTDFFTDLEEKTDCFAVYFESKFKFFAWPSAATAKPAPRPPS